jgi:hypothetical protein
MLRRSHSNKTIVDVGADLEMRREETTQQVLPLVELLVDIDFDEASREWNANKKKMKNGMYKYICIKCFPSGRLCGRIPLKDSDFCKAHSKK